MSKIKTGGPAHPFLTWQNPQGFSIGSLHEGMTLRDHFAGLAMLEGLRRSNELFEKDGIEIELSSTAEEAYGAADAMIAARGH